MGKDPSFAANDSIFSYLLARVNLDVAKYR